MVLSLFALVFLVVLFFLVIIIGAVLQSDGGGKNASRGEEGRRDSGSADNFEAGTTDDRTLSAGTTDDRTLSAGTIGFETFGAKTLDQLSANLVNAGLVSAGLGADKVFPRYSITVHDLLRAGDQHLKKLEMLCAKLNDLEIEGKVKSICRITASMLHMLDQNPDRASSVQLFLDYYLSALEMHVEEYVNCHHGDTRDTRDTRGTRQAESDIPSDRTNLLETIEDLETVFNKQLDILNNGGAIDIDISADDHSNTTWREGWPYNDE